jgi:uncharacterized membrane protein
VQWWLSTRYNYGTELTWAVVMSERTETLRWQPMASLVLSIIGLAGSLYLTVSHFDSHIALVCPDLGACNRILTSNTSHFLGIPVPVLGLAFFVPMTLLCLPMAWRSDDRRIHLARLVLSILGVGMIIYLFIEELFIIQAFCIWCSMVHLVGFLLFVTIVTASPVVLAPDAVGTLAGADQIAS